MILERSSFLQKVEEKVSRERLNVEWAVKTVAAEYADRQSAADDDHLRDKRLDIEDVCRRLQSVLDGPRSPDHRIYAGAVVIAHELRPSEVMELRRSSPAAILTERGGWTSHSSILAREFMIPMISGIKAPLSLATGSEHIIVDGDHGEVIVNPARETIERYARTVAEIRDLGDVTVALSRTTLDGVEIAIRANIDLPEAYQLAHRVGARGIGLFRSESLITRPGLIPDEETQRIAYERLADVAGEDGVRIRTFDVGLERHQRHLGHPEVNPALGLRSLRLSLHEQSAFRTQVRAVLRASAGRHIDLLLPMVAGAEEVLRARQIIDEEKSGLTEKHIEFGDPGIGAMIEIPSGVFSVESIARHADFLAIGTNDLVQYLLAVDRDNDSVAEWYQTLHPGVLKALEMTFSAANSVGIPAIVCGEMAGSPFYLPLLLGLGARELSMNANSIAQVTKLISRLKMSTAVEVRSAVEGAETASEVESRLRDFYRSHLREVLPAEFLNTRHL